MVYIMQYFNGGMPLNGIKLTSFYTLLFIYFYLYNNVENSLSYTNDRVFSIEKNTKFHH